MHWREWGMNNMDIQEGETYTVKYPFSRAEVSLPDGEGGFYTMKSWSPGCRDEWVPPDDVELVADGHGEMLLNVVARFKPGKYPERIFYTRQWKDPDGKVFGKTKLHIAAIYKFRRLAAGYYFDYRVSNEQP